ncbi:MAG: hypothetical protein Q8O14_11425 [bacterium]|jgi:hypothetical protein|nr:hypothetical protein [bacterium]
MRTLKQAVLATLTLLLAVGLSHAAKPKSYTLDELAKNIDQLEKKEIVLKGTIVGACMSGCKMWVAMGDYKDGDLFALVRAKDDAFTFDTKAAGKSCTLTGYAVASYLDYCADEAAGGEAAEIAKAEKESGVCKAPVNTDEAAKKEKQLQDITFFATKVQYK